MVSVGQRAVTSTYRVAAETLADKVLRSSGLCLAAAQRSHIRPVKQGVFQVKRHTQELKEFKQGSLKSLDLLSFEPVVAVGPDMPAPCLLLPSLGCQALGQMAVVMFFLGIVVLRVLLPFGAGRPVSNASGSQAVGLLLCG